ncbi:MAG: hypothetical protein IPK78_04515 [Rhodospirillales bacterium]|nr:hypothetical protein [Rhodospirillales bacterium]
MDLRYTREKLTSAVCGMAQSAASLQQRTFNAYGYSLIRLTPEDFPHELKLIFAEIVEAMSAGEPGVMAMSDAEAEAIARKIVHLYDEVNARYVSTLE